jgi:hypothetical protein
MVIRRNTKTTMTRRNTKTTMTRRNTKSWQSKGTPRPWQLGGACHANKLQDEQNDLTLIIIDFQALN